MRVILIAAAMTLVAGSAFAGADFTLKDKGTNAQGNCVGVASSAGTGNGAVVGGNGTMNGQPLPASGGGSDQTTFPGSRAAEVHAAQQAPCNRADLPN